MTKDCQLQWQQFLPDILVKLTGLGIIGRGPPVRAMSTMRASGELGDSLELTDEMCLSKKEMKMQKSKNLPLAIGLNILLPGLGYIYYGKWLVGLAGGALVVAIAASNPARNALMVWLMMNAIMLIDMLMLHSRTKKKFAAANLVKCPSCAESIMKEAKKCRFCGESLKEAA